MALSQINSNNLKKKITIQLDLICKIYKNISHVDLFKKIPQKFNLED